MKRILTFLILLTIGFTAYSQQHLCPPSITHQGVTYSTVWAGGNCWMKENLRSTAYASQSNVVGLTPTYVVYPNVPYNFGYLYTWYSAVGLPEGSTATPPTAISERVQGICPNEWAMPSTTQLAALYAAGEPRDNAAGYWVYGSAVAPSGTNGFNMIPAGYFNAQSQNFYEYNLAGYLWALNYNGTTSSCGIFPFDCRSTSNISMNKYNMLSVRCVKAPPYGVEEITACDSYTWNGNTYNETGRYVAYLPNDSVSTLLLTVNYTTYGVLDIIACDSYYWNITDQTYTTSGTHMATISNYLGCDSIVTLNLEVRYSNTGVDVQNHCDSYTWIDGITYTESTNTPTFVVTNAAGCDSTVTLNLTIRKMTTGIDVQDHCDAYTWIDGNTYTESTNEPTFTLTNAAGCDSVVTLNLTIRNKTYGVDVQDHCDTYTWMNGITYTASTNDPVYTITNAAGCDSIVTLNLTIRNRTSSPSQSYTAINTYTWNEVTYTTSGIYTATLTNAVGCDSTATLDLTVLYQFPITYNLNDGVLPAEYPENYIQGVGATLPIPTKPNNRFDGWYDNPTFTGSPITAVSNIESGNKQYWALWTVLQTGTNSYLSFAASSTNYALIPNAPELNPTNAITIEAWIYPTAWRTYSYEGSIVTKEIASGNGGYMLRCGTSSGTLSFALGIGTSFQEVTANGLVLNQWQHVVGVYDGSTMKIYRNGVLLNTKTQTGTINSSSNPVEIGRNPAYTSRYFTGRIDEVRLWNTALDAATIQSWYTRSITPSHANYSNLYAYYEMDNTTNPTAIVGSVGPSGTVAVATYGSGGNCNFSSNSPYLTPASTVAAYHPIPSHLTNMLPVVPGDTLAQILRIEVDANLGGNATQFVINTNGTSDVIDLTKARLWFTGTSSTFATTTAFGTPIVNPNGTISFIGNQPLVCGRNYFFLTYDISSSATINNIVDAELVNCVVERLALTPSVGAPTGNRLIVDPCKYQILGIRDTYGDSWNNGNITVYQNSTAIFTNLTITVGTGSAKILDIFEYPIFSNVGDTIKIVRTADGSYASEMRFQLLDGRRNPIIADVQPPVAPGLSAIAGCYTNITTSISANGTITPAAGTIPVIFGSSKSFIYKANTNYYTDSVLINGVNNIPLTLDTIYTFNNVTTPQTLRVIFKTNVITSSAGANGTISPSGTTNVGRNGLKQYIITPNQYYYIDSLIVDGVNRVDSIPASSFTFTNVNENHTIRVVFKTDYVTPTMVTPPTTGLAYEGYALSTVTLSDGSVQYNGTEVPGTYSWVTPTNLVSSAATFTASVLFTPTTPSNYLPITFNVTGNVTLLSTLVAATGTSTTNTYIPFEGYNLDGAQNNFILYPDTMLTSLVGKTINKMTFFTTTPASGSYTANVTIKLGPTTLTGLTTETITYTPTTVYTGTVAIVGNQVTITFSTPYLYTGGNLLFEFSNVAGNWISATFSGVTRTNCSRRKLGSATPTVVSFIPKTRFTYLP